MIEDLIAVKRSETAHNSRTTTLLCYKKNKCLILILIYTVSLIIMEFICCEFHPLSSILVYVTRKYYIVCECWPLIFLIYTVSLIIMKFICCVGHPLSSILVYVARKILHCL